MELLRTKRIVLRAWDEADLSAFFDIYSRDEVTRRLGAHPRVPVADLEDARRRLKGWCDFHAGFEAPFGLWAIVPLDETGATASPVGTALLLQLSDADGPTEEVEIGWHLHPDFQGRGLATEAAEALLADLPPDAPSRVLALTDLDNIPSQAVATRLGMVDQGQTDRWFGEVMRQYCWTRPAEGN
jgi:RimJ/RimL family protein N-acetyltransferase